MIYDLMDWEQHWPDVIASVTTRDARVGKLLDDSRPISCTNNELHIGTPYKLFVSLLRQFPKGEYTIGSEVEALTGYGCKVHFVHDTPDYRIGGQP